MKEHKLLSLIALILIMVLAYSCKVTYPNEKLLIGKWRPVKIDKYTEPGTVPATTAKPASISVKPGPTKPSIPQDSASINAESTGVGTATEVEKENRLSRSIRAEERTSLEIFREKKTVVKTYQGKPFKGTWKMKNKGTQVVAKDNLSGRKFIIDIMHINDTSVVVLERLPWGNLKITYHKEK